MKWSEHGLLVTGGTGSCGKKFRRNHAEGIPSQAAGELFQPGRTKQHESAPPASIHPSLTQLSEMCATNGRLQLSGGVNVGVPPRAELKQVPAASTTLRSDTDKHHGWTPCDRLGNDQGVNQSSLSHRQGGESDYLYGALCRRKMS